MVHMSSIGYSLCHRFENCAFVSSSVAVNSQVFLWRPDSFRAFRPIHTTWCDASRYIAMRRVALYASLSVYTGKALPDIFSYNGVTITRQASRSRFTNSGNSLNCIAKAKKKRWFFDSKSLETTKTAKSSSPQFNLRNELHPVDFDVLFLLWTGDLQADPLNVREK